MIAPEKRTPAGGPGSRRARIGQAAASWKVYQRPGIETLLARLDRVKQTGPGKWIARCPAHEDRTPSLSIRECGDGTILLHDFSGCGAADILGAVGLELRDLFPERLKPRTPEERAAYRADFKRLSWAAALRVLDREAMVVETAAGMLRQGVALTTEDDDRLTLAAQRIHGARAVLA